ncbi:MAG: glucokinase [Terrimicrobiaceae bacterium]|nr:glucokinase [Terrimicrobiaceae bacterium]
MARPPKLLLLAGDVGGTKTNLAIFAPDEKEGSLQLLRNKRYPSADFDSLNAIAQRFLGKGDEEKIHAACFGVPGPVRNNRSQPTNLKWEVDSGTLRADLGIPCVHLLNDLAANAYGITELADADFETLQTGLKNASGNRCVVSPGTGLGEAGLYWDGGKYRVWACEGGHTDFAPRSEIEVELLAYLQTRFGHVSNERVISGQGLANIYAFLRDTAKFPQTPAVAEEMKTADVAQVVTKFAEAGSCPMCMQAIEIFAHCLAMEAGNFALKAMATGGVYLGGGVPVKLLWKLRTPAFREAFNAKGRLEPVMESMPVRVILNDQAALLGAARYALDALEE